MHKGYTLLRYRYITDRTKIVFTYLPVLLAEDSLPEWLNAYREIA
jgi:hypothetical protein